MSIRSPETTATDYSTSPATANAHAPDATRSTSDIRKATFNLPLSEIEALQRLAKRRNTTATQAIRQALADELYLQERVDEGARLLYRLKGALMEIVFPHMRQIR